MPAIEFWHDHAGISVPDLEAAVSWYQKVLGFQEERRINIASIPAKVAVMINGNLRVELFEPENGQPPHEDRRVPDADVRTWGNKHTCFAVEDVVVLADELRRRGADIVWVKQLPFGGAACFLRDNAGNLIEFAQRARPATSHASL